MSEVLNVLDMLANKYEPCGRFRWILTYDGIDAFLVKKISVDSFVRVGGNLRIKLTDAIAPSGANHFVCKAIDSLEENQNFDGHIAFKLIDSVGTVVELFSLVHPKIEHFSELQDYDYHGQPYISERNVEIDYDDYCQEFHLNKLANVCAKVKLKHDDAT